MNTGIQDAANLAWKLASVIHGAPSALLDTYEEERGRVGDVLLAAYACSIGIRVHTA